jgi:predicted ATPase/DNA-binding CsgD family transcriptional regulator
MAPNNIPIRLTTFIGRQAELASVCELLRSDRLVTITGSGGAGKTRLALQASTRLLDSFPHGLWWVDLAPLVEADSVIAGVAQAVGANLVGKHDAEVIAKHLGSQTVLIVFDNCEHLLLPVARLTDLLLRTCPNLRVLTTSRVPLNVPGELPWRIPPLSLPPLMLEEPEKGSQSGLPVGEEPTGGTRSAAEMGPDRSERGSALLIDRLTQFDSAQLFLDRARHTRSSLADSAENAEAIAAICHRLDGIPLAIELAAARTKSLLPVQILEGLKDALRLLAGGSLLVLPRQQTLEGSIQWSCALLDERERQLLYRLAVFRGSFDLAGVEAVCSGPGIAVTDVLDALECLIDHSLVVPVDKGVGGRFKLLETVRQFGLRQLQSEGTAQQWQKSHAAYYAHVAKKVSPLCETKDQLGAVGTLEVEQDNLRNALSWFRDTNDAVGLGDMVCDLGSFWNIGGDRIEGVLWSTRSLALFSSESNEPSALQAQLLARRAEWLLTLGNPLDAYADCTAAMAMGKAVGDLRARGRGSSTLTTLYAFGARNLWKRQWEKTVDLLSRAGDTWSLTNSLIWGAVPFLVVGRTKEGVAALDAVRPKVMAVGQPMLISTLLIWEALAANQAGRPAQAEALILRALADNALGSFHRTTGALTVLEVSRGWRGLQRGDSTRNAGLAKARRDGEAFAAEAYSLLGAVAVLRHDPNEARRRVDGWLAGSANDSTLTKTPGLLIGAQAAFLAGDLADAETRSVTLIEWATEHGEVLYRYRALVTLAAVQLLRSETTVAEASVREAISAHLEFGNHIALPEAIELLGVIAAKCGDGMQAARLFGASSAMRALMETPLSVPFDSLVNEGVDSARAVVGPAQFEVAFAGGSALKHDEIVAYIERTRGPRSRPSIGWNSLTPTELQVAELIREGLTNREIAQRLLMGTETVKTHLSHIFSKLDISRRSQLATMAIQRIGEQKGIS